LASAGVERDTLRAPRWWRRAAWLVALGADNRAGYRTILEPTVPL
jgi:hypothetical protein